MACWHNHGYEAVDPLKRGALEEIGFAGVHNHGYEAVDPLKLRDESQRELHNRSITTVMKPWTH